MNNRFSSPLEVLRHYWGHDSFRPLQAEIIDSVMSGADTLGLLPTGGGKSVTFQVPAMLLPGLTLVVTPLISLMKDQVDNLRAIDIPASCLHSGMSFAEQRLALQKAEIGRIKLLYLSPEKLCAPRFSSSLRGLDVSLIVVDEAHCISQWGYDFRPSYLRIAGLRQLFPSAPILALTASATPDVVADIRHQLEFRPGHSTFAASFARPNISYVVRQTENKPERLLRVLRSIGGCAIVYVRSRKRTREIAEALRASGISAEFYHAGLAPEEKTRKQQMWKDDRARVMVATNAFGMGIDKPDVRVVVHYDLPSSLEEYYQEAGRAGRDGKPSFAVVLVSAADKASLTRRLNESFPPKDFIAEVYDRAALFIDLALGEGYNQVFDFNFDGFCRQLGQRPGPIRAALKILTRAGYFEFEEDADSRARVMITASKDEIYSLRLTEVQDQVLQHLLRTCPGLFADYVQITETSIADDLQITPDEVYQALLGLARTRAVSYIPRRQTPYLFYTSRRILKKHIELPRAVYDDMRLQMEKRIDAMRRFAFGDPACRASAILTYFGQKDPEPCGCCDRCRESRPRQQQSVDNGLPSLTQRILHIVRRHGVGGIDVATLASELGLAPEQTTPTIRSLLDDRILCLKGTKLSL